MKYFCVGLSKTGTTSLFHAMMNLGFKSLHWAPERLNDVIMNKNSNPNWNRYDDMDFICDIPAACFHKEILKCYPNTKIILTIRNEESWLESMSKHVIQGDIYWKNNDEKLTEIHALHKFVYGSEKFHSFFYKKKFNEHNEEVQRLYPNCLIMNICEGDGWKKLCPFINKDIPDIPFPKKNINQTLKLL